MKKLKIFIAFLNAFCNAEQKKQISNLSYEEVSNMMFAVEATMHESIRQIQFKKDNERPTTDLATATGSVTHENAATGNVDELSANKRGSK